MQTRVTVVLACLLFAAVIVLRADRQEDVPLPVPFAAFPMELGTWAGVPQPPLTEAVAKVLGADDYLTRAYFTPAGTGVGLFVGYWQSQRQGDTMHSPLNCLPGAGWQPMSVGMLTFEDPRFPDGRDATVNRVVIQKGLEKQLVLYWYQSHGRIVASEYWGRFYLMADAMRLNRTDGSIVRIVSPIPGDTPDAETSAERSALDFARLLLPELDEFLPR
jgi:EpsI family protein